MSENVVNSGDEKISENSLIDNKLFDLESCLTDEYGKDGIITLGQIHSNETDIDTIKEYLQTCSYYLNIDEIITRYPHTVNQLLIITAVKYREEDKFWSEIFLILSQDNTSDEKKNKFENNYSYIFSLHNNLLKLDEPGNFFTCLRLQTLLTDDNIKKLKEIKKKYPSKNTKEMRDLIINELTGKLGDGIKKGINHQDNSKKIAESIVYPLVLTALFDTDKTRVNNAKLSLKQLLIIENEDIPKTLLSDVNQLVNKWDNDYNLDNTVNKIGELESSIQNLNSRILADNTLIQDSLKDILNTGTLFDITELLSAVERQRK